jgi:hypothetical protein
MWLDPRRYEVMDDAMAAVLRAKTPEEKLAMADGIWRLARDLVRDKLRLDHPEWDESQIAGETARRMAHGAG